MHRWFIFLLLLPSLSEVAAPLCAQEPRALIERAIEAMGGKEALQRRLAVRMKVKGIMNSAEGRLPLTGELWEFDHRSRLTLCLEFRGTSSQLTIVTNGDKSWVDSGGHVRNLSKEDLEAQRAAQHQDRVTSLTALLTDTGFTFARLNDIQVLGRVAHGIKVSYKGQPDTNLYFDHESGLLVKYAYRARKADDAKEALQETILSDYREPDLAEADEKILREAGIDPTPARLLSFIRKQTPSPESLEKARVLIRQLGDESFKVRQQASAELAEMSVSILPLLHEARKNRDREIARRARECLESIGEASNKTTLCAAVRVLALRNPAGAGRVLLDYLCSADEDVAGEAGMALFAIAQQRGNPDPVMLQALNDKDPLRREVASAVLGKDGGAYARQPGRRLYLRPRKIAMKHQSRINGKLEMELETFDYQFFNAFEDKVFARP